jgi:hypothetical protein
MILLRDDVIAAEPGEAIDLGFDFSDFPEADGSRITSASLAILEGSPLTLGPPAVLTTPRDGIPAGLGVTVRASDFVAGATHTVRCSALWDTGAIRSITGRIQVRA